MKGFGGDITIKKVSETEYELAGNIAYENDTLQVLVLNGFITDGASIPRAFWRVIGSPFTGKYTASAIIHDALYASELLSRKECDELFLEMLRVEGVGYAKRYAMYWAVRAGGGFVWDNHTSVSVDMAKRFCKAMEV